MEGRYGNKPAPPRGGGVGAGVTKRDIASRRNCQNFYWAQSDMYRSHTCGQLRATDAGQTVTLSGWVNSRRDHGGVIFIDLRDRYGLTQVTCNPTVAKAAWAVADKVRDEYVVQVSGTVKRRPPEMVNPKMATGEVEVFAATFTILNPAKTPPFSVTWVPEADDGRPVDPSQTVNEEVRLKYRYLDLRRKPMLDNLVLRARFIKLIRDFLHRDGFLEVETPLLTKSSPEGARDFLVPSRLHPGKFYALPQSPQQYKQLLMVAGVDKYFQIAPCLRDEDARADRSPGEFYQLDLEMSFVQQDDILNLMERLFTEAAETLTVKKILTKPWPRLSFDDVMLRFGVDKPDLRFGLEIHDLSALVAGCGFTVFAQALKHGGVVRALNATGAGKFSRSEIDALTEFVKKLGAKGLAYIVVEGDGKYRSPIIKFLGPELTERIVREMDGHAGDIIFFGADRAAVVCEALGQLRNELGRRLQLADPNTLAFCFIVDWPLFEPEREDGHFAPAHHMFTMPKAEDWPKLDTDPAAVRSLQHDMVLNGLEVGGGSIRIHRADIQEKIFKLIGFQQDRIRFFAHMLQAFQFGAPPHGGMAPGIDRLVMLFAGTENIREVTAFPKNAKAQDLMMGAPDVVEPEQLKELRLKVVGK